MFPHVPRGVTLHRRPRYQKPLEWKINAEQDDAKDWLVRFRKNPRLVHQIKLKEVNEEQTPRTDALGVFARECRALHLSQLRFTSMVKVTWARVTTRRPRIVVFEDNSL